MGFKCPNCETVHEKVEGYVSQDVLTSRLSAKSAENKALTDEVKRLRTDAGDVAAIRAERDRLKAEIEEVQTQAQVAEAFGTANVDPAAREGFRAIYDSQMAGKGEGDRVAYHEWIGSDEARNHVLLAPHYKGEGDTTPAATTQPTDGTPPTPRPRTSGTDTGSPAPTTGAPITPDALGAYFQSDAFRAMELDKQREVTQSLMEQARAGTLTALPG